MRALGAAFSFAGLASGRTGFGDGAALGALSRGGGETGGPPGTRDTEREPADEDADMLSGLLGMMRDLVPEDPATLLHHGALSWICYQFYCRKELLPARRISGWQKRLRKLAYVRNHCLRRFWHDCLKAGMCLKLCRDLWRRADVEADREKSAAIGQAMA